VGISRNYAGESGDFWRAAESVVREIKDWSEEYKKDIVISSQGSGFIRQKPLDAGQDPKIDPSQSFTG
jgi:hypothetical protein